MSRVNTPTQRLSGCKPGDRIKLQGLTTGNRVFVVGGPAMPGYINLIRKDEVEITAALSEPVTIVERITSTLDIEEEID